MSIPRLTQCQQIPGGGIRCKDRRELGQKPTDPDKCHQQPAAGGGTGNPPAEFFGQTPFGQPSKNGMVTKAGGSSQQ